MSKTHGQSWGENKTPEYKTWTAIIERCHNQRSKHFKKYGARGLTVCERWRDSFVDFFSDMGRRPSSDYSIERVNNERGYEPGNCKWATRIEQANNKRCTVFVIVNGENLPLAEACRRLGIPRGTIYSRVFGRGMTYQEALY